MIRPGLIQLKSDDEYKLVNNWILIHAGNIAIRIWRTEEGLIVDILAKDNGVVTSKICSTVAATFAEAYAVTDTPIEREVRKVIKNENL